MRLRAKTPYFLVFILLFFSGNPLASLLDKYSMGVGLMVTIYLLRNKIGAYRDFKKYYVNILLFLLALFVAQLYVLDFVSWLGVLNFLAKVFMGGLIVHALKDRLSHYFFKTTYFLSVVSLCGYLIINLLHIPLPGIPLKEDMVSYLLYSTTEFHFTKNQGMFWEPGAFAGVLTLCLGLNIYQLSELWKTERTKLVIVIIALLTTQSTTGYLVGFAIFVMSFLSSKRKTLTLILLPVIGILGYTIYENTEFLKEKIEDQYQTSKTLNSEDFSNSRFGSLIFDWHYIEKHPIIGNGLHEKTRYLDHPYLIQRIEMGDNLGNGNGFSNFLASMGVIFMLLYFVLLYKAAKPAGVFFAVTFLLVVLLNLQGEGWLQYPLYLGLPFLVLNRKKQNDIHSYSRI